MLTREQFAKRMEVAKPLFSDDAEKAYLGFLVSSKKSDQLQADTGISTEDFYIPAHRAIFQAWKEAKAKYEAVDVVAVSETLRASKGGESAYGVLVNCVQGMALVKSSAVTAAGIIKGYSVRRNLIATLSEAIFRSFDPKEDVGQIVDEAGAALTGASSKGRKVKILSQWEVWEQTISSVEKLLEHPGPIGIPTGYASLDRVIAGLCPGDYIILAGRPGTGKTAFSLALAKSAAESGSPVLYFTLEQPAEQLYKRLLSAHFRIDAQKFRGVGRFTKEELENLYSDEAGRLAHLPIHYYDLATIKPSEFRAICRAELEKHGIKLIVVDYLGRMSPDKSHAQRYQDFAEISEAVCVVKKELNLPVLALAQMNRGIESRKGKPQLSDLRETGNFEQDADSVFFLYRPDKDDDDPQDQAIREVIVDVAKNRHGPLAEVPLMFEGKYFTFYEQNNRY